MAPRRPATGSSPRVAVEDEQGHDGPRDEGRAEDRRGWPAGRASPRAEDSRRVPGRPRRGRGSEPGARRQRQRRRAPRGQPPGRPGGRGRGPARTSLVGLAAGERRVGRTRPQVGDAPAGAGAAHDVRRPVVADVEDRAGRERRRPGRRQRRLGRPEDRRVRLDRPDPLRDDDRGEVRHPAGRLGVAVDRGGERPVGEDPQPVPRRQAGQQRAHRRVGRDPGHEGPAVDVEAEGDLGRGRPAGGGRVVPGRRPGRAPPCRAGGPGPAAAARRGRPRGSAAPPRGTAGRAPRAHAARNASRGDAEAGPRRHRPARRRPPRAPSGRPARACSRSRT